MNDIFTLARDRGAVAGVRFSEIVVCIGLAHSLANLAPVFQLFFRVHHQ